MGHPTHSRAHKQHPGESGRSQQRVRIKNSQLSQISTGGAWSRKEGTISPCPFLSTFKLTGNKALVTDSFSPPFTTTAYPLVCLSCVLKTWLRNYWVGDPKVWPDRNVGASPLQLGSRCQLSGELSLSFCWLSLRVSVEIRKVVSFASSLGTPFVSLEWSHIARTIYYLSRQKLDKVFEGFFR